MFLPYISECTIKNHNAKEGTTVSYVHLPMRQTPGVGSMSVCRLTIYVCILHSEYQRSQKLRWKHLIVNTLGQAASQPFKWERRLTSRTVFSVCLVASHSWTQFTWSIFTAFERTTGTEHLEVCTEETAAGGSPAVTHQNCVWTAHNCRFKKRHISK